MSRVIQIRDVPEEVHEALTAAAQAQGLSLTKYVLHEIEQVAVRARRVEANAAFLREIQERVGGAASRESILSALHEGRRE